MASTEQTLNGKWNVKLKHIYDGITIPVVLKYDDANPVSLEVGNTYVTASTEWRTEVGTAIDTNRITFEQTEEVSDKTKTYIVNKINWLEVIPVQRTLTATLSQTTFNNTGGTATLAINSNSNWTITTNVNWISVPTMSGDGSLSQTVTIENYTGTTNRTGIITITCGEIVKTFTVTQNALVPTISISSTTPIEATATSISYTVTSNMNAVTVKYSNQTKTTKTGSFTIPANTGLTPVTHVITASCTDYPTVTATTSVVQNAAGYSFSVSPTSLNFASGGSQSTITINNPNGLSWNITGLPSWISASTTAGTGNATVILTAGQNPNSSIRTGSFVVNETTHGNTHQTINVSQAAREALQTPRFTSTYITYIAHDPEEVILNFNGSPVNFNIYAGDYQWSIKNKPAWLYAKPTSGVGDTVVVMSAYTLSDGYDTREGAFNIVKKNGDDFTYTESAITVYQNTKTGNHGVIQGGMNFNVVPASYSFVFIIRTISALGETHEMNVVTSGMTNSSLGTQVLILLNEVNSGQTSFTFEVELASAATMPSNITCKLGYGTHTTSEMPLSLGQKVSLVTQYKASDNYAPYHPDYNYSAEQTSIQIKIT